MTAQCSRPGFCPRGCVRSCPKDCDHPLHPCGPGAPPSQSGKGKSLRPGRGGTGELCRRRRLYPCPAPHAVPSDTQNGHSTPCAEGGASPAGLDQPPGQMPSEVLPTGCCCAPSPVGVRRLPLSWKSGRPLPRGSPTSPQTGLATVSRADLCPRPKGRALKEVTELKSGHPNVTVDPANVLDSLQKES